ncbi:MAG: cupin [Elusimicrobia bacterium CG08_land_8_20_14_0_20_51_18]|nr:MAG: cupin [Elusimicrobia bacterium CG08_land_8_20_14_0_20_51_18]
MKIFVKKISAEKIGELGIDKWPVWTSPAAEFDWFYEETETCYFLEGRAEISVGGKKTGFGAGELVVFPKGLKCVWKVIEPVKKHYGFTDLSSKV